MLFFEGRGKKYEHIVFLTIKQEEIEEVKRFSNHYHFVLMKHNQPHRSLGEIEDLDAKLHDNAFYKILRCLYGQFPGKDYRLCYTAQRWLEVQNRNASSKIYIVQFDPKNYLCGFHRKMLLELEKFFSPRNIHKALIERFDFKENPTYISFWEGIFKTARGVPPEISSDSDKGFVAICLDNIRGGIFPGWFTALPICTIDFDKKVESVVRDMLSVKLGSVRNKLGVDKGFKIFQKYWMKK